MAKKSSETDISVKVCGDCARRSIIRGYCSKLGDWTRPDDVACELFKRKEGG